MTRVPARLCPPHSHISYYDARVPRIAHVARSIAPIALALAGACTYPSTEVLVVVDTDMPVSQQLTVSITTRRGASDITTATRPDRTFVVGGRDAGIGLPASFAIVPHDGDPRDSLVTLRVEARSGAIVLRRIARFRFTSRQSTTVPVFLTLRCVTPVTGCTHKSPCTQQDLCEERGEACGAEGMCVPLATMTMPTGDAGTVHMDAAFDARDASSEADVRDANDVHDASDIQSMPDAAGCSAGEHACRGSCIPSGACCDDGECGANHTCSSGACVCAAGTRDCNGSCIPSGNCCSDGECGANRVCAGGACGCTAGTRDCNGGCIPSGNCCSDGDCGANRVCAGGACGCAAGTRSCGAQCIPAGACCTDSDCAAPLTCSSPGSACACPAVARMPIYRFARTSNSDHVYSTAAGELSGTPGWIAEGIRFYTYPEPCPQGTIRLRRFADTANNFHFYTSDDAEAASLPGFFVDEGSIGCVATRGTCGSLPLLRKLLCAGAHFYSTSRPEIDAVCGTEEGSVGEVWIAP